MSCRLWKVAKHHADVFCAVATVMSRVWSCIASCSCAEKTDVRAGVDETGRRCSWDGVLERGKARAKRVAIKIRRAAKIRAKEEEIKGTNGQLEL